MSRRALGDWREDMAAFEASFDLDKATTSATSNITTPPTSAAWTGWKLPALPSLDTITKWAKANQTAVVAGAATLFLLALMKRR